MNGFGEDFSETDLEHMPLLHDASYRSWSQWVKGAGIAGVNPNRGVIIDDTNVLVQAAIDGQGVAIGSSLVVNEHLRSGRLVRLFDHILRPDESYYIIYPKAHSQRQNVRLFKNWLLSQI